MPRGVATDLMTDLKAGRIKKMRERLRVLETWAMLGGFERRQAEVFTIRRIVESVG